VGFLKDADLFFLKQGIEDDISSTFSVIAK
jgi:hypothetical protein